MRSVFFGPSAVFSSLGFGTGCHFDKMKTGQTGIRVESTALPGAVPLSVSRISDRDYVEHTRFIDEHRYTRFEKILIACLSDLLQQCALSANDPRTLLIVCTTKGNIDLLHAGVMPHIPRERVKLHAAAQTVADYLGFAHTPMVVSNACISGSLGIILAADLIAAGNYDRVIVAGADILTRFVLSGFVSFKAVSEKPCMPFDKNRSGITPGEAAAAVLLSSEQLSGLRFAAGASGNDATHISAPSRNGTGLKAAVQRMKMLGALSADFAPDTINAHGTATPYNDEMECRTFDELGWASTPLNSYKGFWGHTFGAAGVIETALLLESMKQNTLLPSAGFNHADDYNRLNVVRQSQQAQLKTALKSASGFGGCNATFLILKE